MCLTLVDMTDLLKIICIKNITHISFLKGDKILMLNQLQR
jgi:hypothetical protein